VGLPDLCWNQFYTAIMESARKLTILGLAGKAAAFAGQNDKPQDSAILTPSKT